MSHDTDSTAGNQEENRELIYTYNRELFYHFDREKGFTQTVDYQNPGNQVIIRQGWDAAEQRLEEVRQRVRAGLVSPIAFYMEKMLMDIPMLATYAELPAWRVKRHLKPRVFRKLRPEMLARYAAVFEISAEELKNSII